MGQWTKHFANSTTYVGEDTAISRGQASWRRSQNLDMVQVDLEHNGILLSIIGPGQYWQSDSYETMVSGSVPSLTTRRIERYIEPGEKDLYYRATSTQGIVSFNTYLEGSKYIPILPPWEKKWFVLEHDIQTGNIGYYFSDSRI